MQNSEEQLQILRSEIDDIHAEMVRLFRLRLQVVRKIWSLKKISNRALLDPSREETLIHQFDGTVTDPAEQSTVQNFLRFILAESKKYMGSL